MPKRLPKTFRCFRILPCSTAIAEAVSRSERVGAHPVAIESAADVSHAAVGAAASAAAVESADELLSAGTPAE